ncbi:alpha/beta hydrolase fold-domain-containing protein [Dichotomocladium elegans]|nr:alpha/beta hydrolase fold-domain-containing protein [Dichotomocladium elegans]
MSDCVLDPSLVSFLKSLPKVDITQLAPEVVRAANHLDPKDIEAPAVIEEEIDILTREGRNLSLTITRPLGTEGQVVPVILYLNLTVASGTFRHGGGWVLSDKNTHRGVRNTLTVEARAAVVFVNYSLSPEVRFPVAIEECYDALEWVLSNGAAIKVDPSRLAVAGDSAGGNLAAALTILAKKRSRGDAIKYQALFYPVTDHRFDTGSYLQFEDGYYLTRKLMIWFWDHYLPNEKERDNILASPLKATADDLEGLPPALVITCEADVLRDEGEEYARKLLSANVPVVAARYIGSIHGVLNQGGLIASGIQMVEQAAAEIRKCMGKDLKSELTSSMSDI